MTTTIQISKKQYDKLKERVEKLEGEVQLLKDEEATPVSKEEEQFFLEVYERTKHSRFWRSEADLKKHGLHL